MTVHDAPDPALTRRGVLAGAGLAGAALGAAGAAPAFARARGRDVAVLGGGMAGLAAAHELVERGFRVTVYEPTASGGKARSIPVPDRPAATGATFPASTASASSPASTTTCRTRCGARRSGGNANGVWDNLVVARRRQVRCARATVPTAASSGSAPTTRACSPSTGCGATSPTTSRARPCRPTSWPSSSSG